MKFSLAISNFLGEISSLSNSIVFFYFFALITEEGFLSLFPILQNSAFKWDVFPFLLCLLLFFFSQLFLRSTQMTVLPFCISFSWGWSSSLPPVQCHRPPSIVLQGLCLSDLIPWIYLSHPLYNHKGFDLGHTWMVWVVFPIFFNLSLNLAMRCSWSEPQSATGLVSADCIELLHLWLQRI